MQAYRINHTIIAADIPDEARDCFLEEIGGPPPDEIIEVHVSTEVFCQDGAVKTVRERINEELDARNDWLRMGIPCELHQPFVVGTLK
jgi:hypothetical protein